MGIFNSIKGFFNVDGVHGEIVNISSPSFDNNSQILGQYALRAGFTAHILSVHIAVRAEIEGKEITFARQLLCDEAFTIEKDQQLTKDFSIANLHFLQTLQQQGYNDLAAAQAAAARFFVTIEIDVKEAAGLFDPFTSKDFSFQPL